MDPENVKRDAEAGPPRIRLFLHHVFNKKCISTLNVLNKNKTSEQ
jgi:hypothetical protein